MMSLWDALRMNMMISYQELVRTFLNKLRRQIYPTRLTG
ncbi:ydjO [Escherichia coli]|nr:ydjO [Escherichia coli]